MARKTSRAKTRTPAGPRKATSSSHGSRLGRAKKLTIADLSRQITELQTILLLNSVSQYRMRELVAVTGVSRSKLAAWDRCRYIPGRRQRGKLVRWGAAAVRQWMEDGMPLVKQRSRAF